MIRIIIAGLLITTQIPYTKAQFQYDSSIIKLPGISNKALQISCIAVKGDSIFMPLEKCGQIFRGKLNGNTLTGSIKDLDQKRQIEGMAYYDGNFYFSDDAKNNIYKYNSAFVLVKRYPILLGEHEGINGENGFEGMAVMNDNIFYILLEKTKDEKYSILFRLELLHDKLQVISKNYIRLDSNRRYCDLFYKDQTLYLLRSSYFRQTPEKNQYEIRKLQLDPDFKVLQNSDTIETKPYVTLTDYVQAKKIAFDTNVEGFTMDQNGNIYIVSDNCKCQCSAKPDKYTLLMKLAKKN